MADSKAILTARFCQRSMGRHGASEFSAHQRRALSATSSRQSPSWMGIITIDLGLIGRLGGLTRSTSARME